MQAELQPFVRKALASGATRAAIQEALQKAGWPLDEVRHALAAYADLDFPVPVPKRQPYLSAREAFFYLVLFLTLYVSSISVGTILFQLINRWFPDPLQNAYYFESIAATARTATASLIITFPIFLFMSWLIHGIMTRDPDKRGSKVRKWLTYITLFIAASVIIGDLITLVTNVLSGELTLRFVLKVIVILAIAGTIFGSYLWDLRQDEREA